MVGAFYQPKLVIMNTMALSTLSKKDFNSGMAEIIKHAIIQDVSYLSWLESSFEKIQSMDANTLKEMIYRSCCIKKEVVEQDEKEQSIRALLNFGHTVGHAIEKLMDFELFHGECVALGMIVAGFISFKRGYITVKEFNRIEKIIEDFNLPSKITGLSIDEIIEVTKSDKKVKGSVLHFVLIKALGEASIYTDISNEELSEAIHYIMN
jgi:3-dehydroquinate synthase